MKKGKNYKLIQDLNKEKRFDIRLILAIICLLGFIFFAYRVETGCAQGIDDSIRFWLYNQRRPILTSILKLITYSGNWQTVSLIAIILLIIKQTRQRYGFPMAITSLITVAFYEALKQTFQRPRPDLTFHLINQGGWSFPSGHSMNGILFYGLLGYILVKNTKNKILKKILGIGFFLEIFLIGLSRVYLGVHYPTDILGGWSLGLAITFLATILVDRYYQKKGYEI